MSLKYRRDGRTVEEFERQIMEATNYEAFLIKLFRDEIKNLKLDINVKDNGVDNTGKLIRASVGVKSDYFLTGDIIGPFDIKTNPVTKYCTFKKGLMESYVKKGIGIILFYGLGKNRSTLPENARWCIINTESIQLILNNTTSFSCPGLFGGKPVVRILEKDYGLYFNSHKVRNPNGLKYNCPN